MVWWSPHTFLFNLEKEKVALQTDALTVQNLGRRAAEHIELVMSQRPDFFKFSPPIPFSESATPEGHFVLSFATLGAKEFFTLQILSYTRVPQLLNVRSASGPARQMPFQIARVFPRWLLFSLGFALLVGIGFTAYWAIRAVVFISQSIGLS